MNQALVALAALGHRTRLEIFRLLVRRGPQGHAAGVIADRLDVAAPILSFHAKTLEKAGLVVSRREGRFQIYSANFDAMRALVAYLSDECCSQADGPTGAAQCEPATSQRRKAVA